MVATCSLVTDEVTVSSELPYILESNARPNLIRTQFLATS
jgi:hypothetical protein